jgi:hypothetical protein
MFKHFFTGSVFFSAAKRFQFFEMSYDFEDDDASYLAPKFEDLSLLDSDDKEERKMTPEEEKAIRNLCEQIEDTLKHKMKGYVSSDELAGHVL